MKRYQKKATMLIGQKFPKINEMVRRISIIKKNLLLLVVFSIFFSIIYIQNRTFVIWGF